MTSFSSYLRVENTRLTDDIERTQLEHAHLIERNNTLEQTYLNDQQIIEELKSKNQSLQILQDRFDNDQQQINYLQEKCQLYEQEKENIRQTFQTTIEELNQQKELLNDQLKQSEDKTRSNEEQLIAKTTEMYVTIVIIITKP